MSRTIEQKVVEMRFDNSNFEKNVSQSMDSLNRLKATIDKTSSGNAFSGLSKALDNINIGSVTTAIQTVTEKFSVWEQVAIGAARNIGAALSNYVVKGLNDMVFKNVSVGWDKYAQKTEAVQTIMASIADQDFGNTDKMEYVEGLMEKLNWFTDETSYHLTDMISNIGKFTSAGVDLDKASDAMMGIATWAAVSGANADTASRVMYQLSQSLGMGSVRTQDWMSVETANMATKEFKELAIQVAKTKKEINSSGKAKNGGKNAEVVTFQNFRQTLKDGWLTSDVLTETLAQYSGFANALNRVYDAYGGNVPTSTLIKRFKMVQAEAKKSGKTLKEVFKEKYDIDVDFSVRDKVGNVIGDLTKNITELGMRAFIAAQEAKTFKEAMDSVGDAASTVWMRVYETIFGNYEVAKDLWTNLANDLYELFVDPIWLVSDAFEEWSKQGGRSLLFGREVVSNDDGTEDIIPTGAFDIFIRTVIDASNALRDGFLGALGVTEDNVDEFTGGVLMKFSRKILELSKRFQKFVGPVEDLTKKFKNFFGFFTDIIRHIDIFNQKSEDSLDIVGLIKYRFEDAFSRVENVLSRIKSIIGYVKDGLIAFFDALKFNGTSIQNFTDTAENLGAVGDDIAKALSPITLMFSKLGGLGKKAGTFISSLIATLSFIPKEITGILRNTNLLSNGAFALKKILEAVRDGFNSAFDSSIFVDIRDAFKLVWSGIKTFIDGFNDNFDIYDKVKTIAKGIGSAINLIGRAIRFLLKPIEVLDGMGVFNEIGKFLSGTVLKALLSIPATIGKIITKIDEFLNSHPQVQSALEGIVTILSSIIKFVFVAANSFAEFIGKSKLLSKVGGWISGVFGKLKESESLVGIGNKISSAFESVVAFFRDDFNFENFLGWFEEAKIKVEAFGNSAQEKLSEVHILFLKLTDSIRKFIDKSEFLSNVKTSLQELWENIKKLFSGETNFEGFGADFMAGFGKGLVNNVNVAVAKIKEVGKKVLDAIKDFFGIHSPSTVMEEVGEDLVNGLSRGLIKWRSAKEHPLDAIKKFGSGILSALSFSKGEGGDLNETAKETFKISNVITSIKNGVSKIFSTLLGIGAVALPSVAAIKISNIFHTFMSPFEALENVTNALSWKAKGDVIVNGITALGDAFKKVLLSIGGLVLMFAAAAAVMAVAKKYTEGKKGEDNFLEPMIGMIALIGEVLGIVATMAVALGKLGGKSSMKMEGLSKEGIGNLERNMNQTAEWTKAIGDIFVQLGESMLMFAGAIAILAAVSKYFGKKTVQDVMLYFGIFTATMLGVGFLVAKWSTGATSTTGSFNFKKGLKFEHNGWTENLYAIGAFMLSIGVAMAAMAVAAAIVIKASNGDIKLVEAAFQGMMGIMAIAMVTLAGIVYIQESSPTRGVKKSSSAIKDAAVALAAMAGSIRIIAKSVVMLSKEDPTKLDQGVKIIGKIGIIVFAFALLSAEAKPSQLANAKNVGIMMLEMAASFAVIGIVIKRLGDMDSTKLDQGLRAFASFAMFFGVISAMSLLAAGVAKKGADFGAAGKMLISVSASVLVMSVALKMLDGVQNMGSAILGLLASFTALGLLFAGIAWVSSMKKVKTNKFVEMAEAITIISASLGIMAIALRIMDGVQDMGKVVGGVITAVAALGILLGIISLASGKGGKQGEGLLKTSLGFAAVAVALGAMVKMVADAGAVFAANEGSLQQGAVALGLVVAVMGIIAGIAYVAGDAMKSFGIGMLALGAGVALVAAGFFIFYQTMVLLSAEAALFGGAVGEMVEGFLDKFIALGPKLSASIAMLFKAVANGIADSVIEIVNAVIKIVEEVAKNIDKILSILGPILDVIITFVVDKVTLLITLLQPLVENIVTHIITVLNTILVPGVLTGAQTILDWVLLNIPIIANTIVSTVEMIVTRVLELLDLMINSEIGLLAIIRRALMGENGVLTIIDEFIHQLLENLRNLVTDIIDTLVYILQEVVDGMIEHIDIVLTGVEDLIKKVAEHIVSLTDTILGGIVDVLEGIATAIETHGSNIWKAIWHIVTAIWNSFWGLFSGDGENSISSLAGNIMEGLGNGIKNFVGKVTGKISEIGGTIIGKFKEVFGIASPSKVMASIGEFLDVGLAKGINDNSKPIFTGINGIGDGVIDSLKTKFLGDDAANITGLFGDNISNGLTDALGGITDVLGTDDFTPTITPVLDLSEIQNGASQIPGMINPGSGYTVNTAMVSKSAYNPYEYYDGTKRIAAPEAQMDYFEVLKSKMDEMVNKFASAKVVLDTGAVVGGIVDPMDMALGQRMAQVGRGVYSSAR